MKLRISQDSRIGRRHSNQDRTGYAYAAHRALLVVADGMGGHPRGELAAQIAVERVIERFADWSRHGEEEAEDMLRSALDDAHRAIRERAREERLWDYPRTTCVVCVVLDDTATWCHVGDSRLYFVREGDVLATTRDHSGAWLLVEQGILDADEARVHPDRNFVYNCLGGETAPDIEMSRPVALANGDRIMLCSDGLWSPLSNAEIVAGVVRDPFPSGLEPLLREAQERAGAYSDNLSYVVLAVDDEAGEDGIEIDTIAPGEVVTCPGPAPTPAT